MILILIHYLIIKINFDVRFALPFELSSVEVTIVVAYIVYFLFQLYTCSSLLQNFHRQAIIFYYYRRRGL